eukprot:CAMPEP_0117655558 /NCGR_PEP_ID=MMETSP0804-20121206/4342_1 /TAXON_ID=1074897 /ORGANISM="Tetraselmis astigmatica, Strain CCMP880" /LENGTH=190 /DNA_ID=CAMNT_0005461915 /DNA_START=2131 /DNA_END=2704 /DNA_ORIENTATION=-
MYQHCASSFLAPAAAISQAVYQKVQGSSLACLILRRRVLLARAVEGDHGESFQAVVRGATCEVHQGFHGSFCEERILHQRVALRANGANTRDFLAHLLLLRVAHRGSQSSWIIPESPFEAFVCPFIVASHSACSFSLLLQANGSISRRPTGELLRGSMTRRGGGASKAVPLWHFDPTVAPCSVFTNEVLS